jgi:hypothetical protein
MRQSTLDTLGLGSVLEIFERGKLPVDTGDLVSQVFGEPGERGSLVISGANGIVGAGKTMQLGSRLQPFGVRIVALDFPGAPDGIGKQYQGLAAAFGPKGAGKIMDSIVRLTYDGTRLPESLREFRPRFLLEAIPEILDIKKKHYELFRAEFPDIDIRSVTSGFPSSQLGVGVAHPAFPHEINKVFEVVEPEPTAGTQLLWALGCLVLRYHPECDSLPRGVQHALLEDRQTCSQARRTESVSRARRHRGKRGELSHLVVPPPLG